MAKEDLLFAYQAPLCSFVFFFIISHLCLREGMLHIHSACFRSSLSILGILTLLRSCFVSLLCQGLNPSKALEIFEEMKREGVRPTVVTFSALISACEKVITNSLRSSFFGVCVRVHSCSISSDLRASSGNLPLRY